MDAKYIQMVDDIPFEGMHIQDTSILEELDGRSPCVKCFKSRKYFCYNCYIPISELKGKLPSVKLPIKIDIIKHKHEIDGKSTAIHGAILASEYITIYTYPDIPDYINEYGTYLIYPSKKARNVFSIFVDNNDIDINLSERGTNGTLLKKYLYKEMPKRALYFEELPIKKAIFIDSTWNQSKGIFKDDKLKNLPCVVLQNRISQFWRHQKGSPRWYLATIEAIHQFLLEIHLNMWGVNPDYKGPYCDNYRSNCNDENNSMAYNGQYDNILFFFLHMYKKIHSLYKHDQLLAYKRPFR